MNNPPVGVLAFDVFGTVVDWHTGIARAVNAAGLPVDAAKFTNAWRAGYVPALKRVITGELGWTKLDDLHRMILDDILADFDVPESEVMLVAAHQEDLAAARSCGLQTAYVERPHEFGPDVPKDVSPNPDNTLHARDLGELATLLGC